MGSRELSLVPGGPPVRQQKVSYVAVSVGLWRVLQSPLSGVVVVSGQASLNSYFVLGRLKGPDVALAGGGGLRAAHCQALPGMLCQRL